MATRRPPARLGRRSASPVAPLAAIAVLVLATVVTRIPNLGSGPLDFDEGVYWLSLRSLREGHTLFTQVYSSQPPAFLLGVEPLWSWLGGTIEAARSLMTAWACVAVVAAAITGWRLAGPWTGVGVALIVAVDPRIVDQSVTLQADGPATALALAALAAAAVAVTARGRLRAGLAATAAGALLSAGILTKLFDVGAVPAVGVALLLGRRRPALLVAAAAGGLLTAALVLLPLASSWGAMWQQAVGLHLDARGVDGSASWQLAATIWATEWPVVIAAAAGALVGWWGARRLWVVGMAWCAGSTLALLATHPLFPHHVALLVPGMACLGASAMAAVGRAGRAALQPHARAAAALVTTCATAAAASLLLAGALRSLGEPIDSARIEQLTEFVPPAALIVTDDQFDLAAAGRDAPPFWVDTSGVRLRAEDVTAASLAATPHLCGVLFQSGRLSGVPGLAAWAALAFPEHHVLDGGALLEIRPGCPA
ncbi:MAG: hypothetical protein ACYDAC_10465 [Candidatus Dormibacteria bacterium]